MPAPAMEVVIESLAAGGDGVAHAPDGRVVFVPFTAPGDRVRLRVVASRARFLRGKVEALLAPGPARSDPVCPVFGSCGGCSWQHVSIAAQLDAKRRIVADALRRIGGLAFGGEIGIVPSPRDYGYRARTRVLRHEGRTGYRRRGSNALQAITRCPVLVPELDRALRELAQAPGLADGEYELAAGVETLRCASLAPAGGGDPAGPEGASCTDAPAIELDLLGDRLRISPGVFFQANPALHESLAGSVMEAAGHGDLLLELHAGAGFFTLGLSRRFDRVVAIESDPAAVRDLRHNLARAGRGNVEVREARVEAGLDGIGAPEVVVLDPPRTGLPPEALARLAALGASRVVYLSCDPATLARDCARLAAQGYRLEKVRAFDLFPQTPHVEVLALLALRGREPEGSVHSGAEAGGQGSRHSGSASASSS